MYPAAFSIFPTLFLYLSIYLFVFSIPCSLKQTDEDTQVSLSQWDLSTVSLWPAAETGCLGAAGSAPDSADSFRRKIMLMIRLRSVACCLLFCLYLAIVCCFASLGHSHFTIFFQIIPDISLHWHNTAGLFRTSVPTFFLKNHQHPPGIICLARKL